VDGHSRYGAETFDAGNGLNCEGTERKVELALVTINQPQLLAVCGNLESSPDINNFYSAKSLGVANGYFDWCF
jgi:hypothetical protein